MAPKPGATCTNGCRPAGNPSPSLTCTWSTRRACIRQLIPCAGCWRGNFDGWRCITPRILCRVAPSGQKETPLAERRASDLHRWGGRSIVLWYRCFHNRRGIGCRAFRLSIVPVKTVIPAKAGIQRLLRSCNVAVQKRFWIPYQVRNDGNNRKALHWWSGAFGYHCQGRSLPLADGNPMTLPPCPRASSPLPLTM